MTVFRWTHQGVLAALAPNIRLTGAAPEWEEPVFSGVSTDTRTLKAGDLFVAIRGARFDGHDFVPTALAAGAGGVVVSRRPEIETRGPVYRVPDTLVALGALAHHRRRAHQGQVVAITGSSGKTTTKELLRSALRSSRRVHASPGNLNNRIGLPLTLLNAPDEAEVLVLEMGTNEPGEIGALTAVAEPDIGVVTTVSDAHLEKLGSLDGVFAEKLALVAGLGGRGAAVVGDQPRLLPSRARRLHPHVRVAGWTDLAEPGLRPREPRPDAAGCYSFGWRGRRLRLGIPGRHAVYDALIALAVCELLKVPPRSALDGIQACTPGGMRSEPVRAGALTLLLDCYNANPESVGASLELLDLIPSSGRRVAVLGSMLELGSRSDALHDRLLRKALAADVVLALGEFARAAHRMAEPEARTAELLTASAPAEGYAELRKHLRGDELILLKGSRGVALERMVPLIEADFGKIEAGPARASGSGGR